MAKLWGGRFKKDFTSGVEDFLQSVEVDERMVLEDIWGSEAHAIMLARCNIISGKDLKKILYWLERARKDHASGKLILRKKDEDVHMNVEKYVISGAGPEYGGKLHTARSRNDQVIVDSKLHIRVRLMDVEDKVIGLQKAFMELAQKNIDTPAPGYTHTQDAQPITLGFWASAYVSMLSRDIRRLRNAYDVVDSNPLGACAVAGTSFKTDRRITTKLLGFSKVHRHALDVVSSRDWVAESLCTLTILASNLSKLAEELVLWSTYEFGVIELDDSYSSGSSIMPQKKNPCVAELIRGRTGRVYGCLMQLLTTMKGLPMGYNRDLQEDKPPLWAALDDVGAALDLSAGMISTMKVRKDRLLELSGANFSTATELANHLVREQGMSFRKSHEIVGELVGELSRNGLTFMDFDAVDAALKKQGVKVERADMKSIFDPAENIRTYKSMGSASPKEVASMLSESRKQMAKDMKSLDSRRKSIENAKSLTEDVVLKVLSGADVQKIRLG